MIMTTYHDYDEVSDLQKRLRPGTVAIQTFRWMRGLTLRHDPIPSSISSDQSLKSIKIHLISIKKKKTYPLMNIHDSEAGEGGCDDGMRKKVV